MRRILWRPVLGLISVSILLAAVGWWGSNIVAADSADPAGSGSDTSGSAVSGGSGDSIIPDKYNFANLSSSLREQVKQKIEEEESGKRQKNLTQPEIIADELTYKFRERQEYIRLIEVVLLAIMSLGTLGVVLKCMKDSKVCSARDMLNGIGLVLVIFSTLLVIIIANVEVQLTAAMGVLGGIAGYLFGTLRSSLPHEKGKEGSVPGGEKREVKE